MGEKLWTVNDILTVAMQKYHLLDGYSKDGVLLRKDYEREIRRTMKEVCHLEKTSDGKNLIYEITKREALHIIDFDLYEYFTERADRNYDISMLAKQDKDINLMEEELTESTTPKGLEQLASESVDEYDFDEYIDQRIDRFMLRTLFSLYFDFDEAAYRKDFKLMTDLVKPENNETIQDGYSRLAQRINDPLKYYCRKK